MHVNVDLFRRRVHGSYLRDLARPRRVLPCSPLCRAVAEQTRETKKVEKEMVKAGSEVTLTKPSKVHFRPRSRHNCSLGLQIR